MKVTWLAHAAFLLEGNGLEGGGVRIISDPYSPEVLGLPPIPHRADIVIRSSADDQAHCRADLIGGSPAVVTATEIAGGTARVRNVPISAVASRESTTALPAPRENAMYKFELDGMVIAHFGDVGNALTSGQLDFLSGADIALVPAGGPPTIALTDLFDACVSLAFPLVIPMHYQIPRARPRMLPVTEFASLFSPGQVVWSKTPVLELEKAMLPASTELVVLKPLMSEI